MGIFCDKCKKTDGQTYIKEDIQFFTKIYHIDKFEFGDLNPIVINLDLCTDCLNEVKKLVRKSFHDIKWNF